MGLSGDWRDSTWFIVAFVVLAVVLPAAIAVVMDDSLGAVARATGVTVGLASLTVFGGFTRRQVRGRGRRQKGHPVDSPRSV